MSVDAPECTQFTDTALTEPGAGLAGSIAAAVSDDRLFTVAEISTLLKVPQSAVYSACDRRELVYVKFEGAVQVEGRDLKAWLERCRRTGPANR